MALSLSLLFALLLCCRFPEPSAAGTAAKATLDPALSSGHRFDGVGGVSGGGGGTRLLLDYDEPARSEILDYLFKPGYGASLQVLKVEIGCDGDTTQGAEQTHMRTPDDESPTRFDRGYENWLMVSTKLPRHLARCHRCLCTCAFSRSATRKSTFLDWSGECRDGSL